MAETSGRAKQIRIDTFLLDAVAQTKHLRTSYATLDIFKDKVQLPINE